VLTLQAILGHEASVDSRCGGQQIHKAACMPEQNKISQTYEVRGFAVWSARQPGHEARKTTRTSVLRPTLIAIAEDNVDSIVGKNKAHIVG
jgi:hypothetical protein